MSLILRIKVLLLGWWPPELQRRLRHQEEASDHLQDMLAGSRADAAELRKALEIAVQPEAVARTIVAKLLKHAPMDRNCGIGQGGVCTWHFNEEHCSVAWAKSWVAGYVDAGHLAPLVLVLTAGGTGEHRTTGVDLIAKALTEWVDTHEISGAEGTAAEAQANRAQLQLARAIAHAAGATVAEGRHRVYLPGPHAGRAEVVDHKGCDPDACPVQAQLDAHRAKHGQSGWQVQGYYFTTDGVKFERCSFQPRHD